MYSIYFLVNFNVVLHLYYIKDIHFQTVRLNLLRYKRILCTFYSHTKSIIFSVLQKLVNHTQGLVKKLLVISFSNGIYLLFKVHPMPFEGVAL